MPHSPVYIEFSGRDDVPIHFLLAYIQETLRLAGHSVEGLVKGMEPSSIIKVVVHD